MLRPRVLILIKDNDGNLRYRFPLSVSVEVNSSFTEFTSNAIVELPNSFKVENNYITKKIPIGSMIQIFMGYDQSSMVSEFEGYITKVNVSSSIVLMCEDVSWLYKQSSAGPIAQKATTLKKLIDKAVLNSNISIETPVFLRDIPIGDFSTDKRATLIDVFSELKNKLKVFSYFQNGNMYVNYELDKTPGKVILLDMQGNVPSGSDNIEFEGGTDGSVVSHGVSVQEDGSKIELFAYYKDGFRGDIKVSEEQPKGVLNTFKRPKMTKAELTDLITDRLPNLWASRATGDVMTFGAPSVQHGDTARVSDLRYPERDGYYKIQRVKKTLNVSNGFRQSITLGNKLTN